MSENYKRVCSASNYFEYFLVFISAISGCISIFVFTFIVSVPAGNASFAVRLKVCAITAGIKTLQELRSISPLSRKKGKSLMQKTC